MPPRNFQRIIAAMSVCFLFLAGGHLSAVQVYGTSGTGGTYTTAPSDDFGFANMGVGNSSTSAVYLGNGWVLSAGHVATDNVLLDGTSYTVNPTKNTWVLDPTTHQIADLLLRKLTVVPTDPNLKTLAISATSPGIGANVIMAGYGVNRASSLTRWNVTQSGTTYNWTETTFGGNASGYKYGSGQSMRWGNGVVSGTDSGNDGTGYNIYLYSTFQASNGNSVVSTGDSGGGVFYKRNNTTWELCGILLVLDTFVGQPSSTSVIGNNNYWADLSVYRDQINAVAGVPTINALSGTSSVIAGQSATFSVSATGFGSLNYQWYKDGVAISGATAATYTITSASAADTGSYTVTVTTPYGNTTSSVYSLTVSTPVSALPPWLLAVLALLMCVVVVPSLET